MKTYDGHVSLHFPLTISKVSCCQSVASFHSVDDGDVAEEHDKHGNEVAEDEDGDDVGAEHSGVSSFRPINLTGPIATICRKVGPLTRSVKAHENPRL